MLKQCGVWMNHQEAIIVMLDGREAKVEQVTTEVESQHRSTGGVRGDKPYSHRSVNSSARLSERRHQDWRRHYGAVLSKIPANSALLIMGSGPARVAFASFVAENAAGIEVIGVEASRRLSTAQVVAKVKKAYGIEVRGVPGLALPTELPGPQSASMV